MKTDMRYTTKRYDKNFVIKTEEEFNKFLSLVYKSSKYSIADIKTEKWNYSTKFTQKKSYTTYTYKTYFIGEVSIKYTLCFSVYYKAKSKNGKYTFDYAYVYFTQEKSY